MYVCIHMFIVCHIVCAYTNSICIYRIRMWTYMVIFKYLNVVNLAAFMYVFHTLLLTYS